MLANRDDYLQYQVFLDFRQMLVRAIEKAWQDKDFYCAFGDDPIAAFKAGFDYTFPYDLELTTECNSAEWRPVLMADLGPNPATSWVVTKNSVVKLILPPAPPEEQRKDALANYQATHWSFLNRTLPDNEQPLQGKRRTILDQNAPTPDSMSNFGKHLTNAIALAWKDPVFKEQLKTDPIYAMENYLHYRCPGILKLELIEPTDPDKNKWDPVLKQWHLEPSRMSVGLPQTPLNQLEIAGNAYLDAPSGYLVVCC